MFNKQNFCHIASNNRNEVKVGVFVYKTTDDLATVTTSGYFNDKIVDINLHDLIIHEWHDTTDRTKVQRNVLCVTERTLDNVGTQIIKTDWEEQTDETLEQLATDISGKVSKSGDTMTNPLKFILLDETNSHGAIGAYLNGVALYAIGNNDSLDPVVIADKSGSTRHVRAAQSNSDLGNSSMPWRKLFVQTINNGYDIAVPVTAQADTLGLKSEIDLAANSGSQLTNKGVWFAKMYAATTVPTGAEYDGKNYADFSQVDTGNNPIIVLYEGQNGAWVETDIIAPPADYNGYVTVTSKIWDIVEQAGQQGGLVLWAYNTKTFTPYPRIVSFEDAALTGTPTAPNLTAGSPNNQIVNKQALDNAIVNSGTGRNVGDIFFTSRTDSALNGAVECNGGQYNTTDFTGAQSIGDLLEGGKVPYVSLSTYTTLLTTQGSVGVFGWDGVGTTAFRVPSLEDIFIETGTAAQVGDYLAPSIPNLKGVFQANNAGGATASGIVKVKSSTAGNGWDGTATVKSTYEIDASTASGVYDDNATTVQPNAVRYRAMVQLAVSATDEAVETCTSVLADVAELKYDYVVDFQAPTAANNYTWYRKYKSGWVEQGGRIDNGSLVNTVDLSVVFPVEMADTNYTPSISCIRGASGNYKMNQGIETVSTTGMSFGFYSGSDYCQYFAWKVEGMAQQ